MDPLDFLSRRKAVIGSQYGQIKPLVNLSLVVLVFLLFLIM